MYVNHMYVNHMYVNYMYYVYTLNNVVIASLRCVTEGPVPQQGQRMPHPTTLVQLGWQERRFVQVETCIHDQ